MPAPVAPTRALARRRRSARSEIARLAASVMTLKTTRRLAKLGNGVAAQEHILADLLPQLARTAFGRQAGLPVGAGYADFRRCLVARTYEGFASHIERMKTGEADVLWPGKCRHFAVSSGTTAGPSKFLPVNDAMLAHFRRAGLDSLFLYTARTGHTQVFGGRHLFLGGSTALLPLDHFPGAVSGDLSGITALNMPGWVERFLYEPGAGIAQMNHWPAKLEAIAARTLDRDITLLAGIPSWLLVLADTVRARARRAGRSHTATLREVWPNLECLIHGGVPVEPFEAELRRAIGPGVNFHEVYPASEGFIAAQDVERGAGLRLLADCGVFYEFIPLHEYEESRLAELGEKIVPLAGVQPGINYVLLLTTPVGLSRYVLGDLVRFTSLNPPRLVYVGRTKLQLSAFGEHVIEKELTDALAAVASRHDWSVVNFHVAPRFPDPAAGRPIGRHEWWVEFKSDPVGEANCHVLATELDRELSVRNDDYAAKRGGGGLALPDLQRVPPGHFERWLKQAGKWGGQSKMPRCRSDRIIADQLAALARP